MTELEQQIIGIISAAGDSKGKAHKIQTKLIQSEMDPEAEKPELSLLMVHAQDHYMTSQLARDVIEALVDVFEAKEGGN